MKNRNSKIELLKIFAMLLITLNHVIQSTGLVDGIATNSISIIILNILRCSGNLGNVLFVIASCYFLLESDSVKSEKIMRIIIDSLFISILWIIPFLFKTDQIPMAIFIKQLFPTFFGNNWFIGCYLLLYIIHPFLNIIIKNISQKIFLKIVVVLLFLYSFAQQIQTGNLYYNDLVSFIVLYFIVAYVKNYMPNFNSNMSLNKLIAIVSLLLNVLVLIIINYVSFYFSININTIRTNSAITNPLYIAFGVSTFNIFKNGNFSNRVIDYISSLSLIYYLIHENFLFRRYARAELLKVIFNNNFTIINILSATSILFFLGIILSIFYDKLVRGLSKKISCIVFKISKKVFSCIESIILKVS